jgi:hypothetical protein
VHTPNPRRQENVRKYGNTDPEASTYVEPTLLPRNVRYGKPLIDSDDDPNEAQSEEEEIPEHTVI